MAPRRQHSCLGLTVLAFATLTGSLALSGTAEAAIQRCIGAQGEPMFAEHCAAAPTTPTVTQRATARTVQAVAPARAGDFCARTPESLARQVDAALRARNGVRFSGYALWQGRSARHARGGARDLLGLLRAASLSVALRPASAFDAETSDASLPMLAVMRMTARAGVAESEELWFHIVRARGCYWLDPQPERRREDLPPTVVDVPAGAAAFAATPY